ncbi:hypothetical protein PIB30_079903 [Stylosanthes scabra]|uniref:Legume lectin domain-containing protein n=1 Tax=Stylosanthes scabra TaxID=79078 RepID=A0ABU6UTM6_9FABA|nr:hypothetical protein [Stylosanthes scabra]
MKPSCVILAFFLLLVASKNASSIEVTEFVNFNFESFTNGNPLIELQGNATIQANGSVLLTDPTSHAGVGRVMYAPSFRLWDTVSGNVASFVTSFSFQTTNYQDFVPADGIIFFIGPYDTQIPGGGVGGSLGVADSTGQGEFFGVEFDNYVNGEFKDPPYSHVGIDDNSVFSKKTVEWKRMSGAVVNVTVIYDSSSKILSVALRNNVDIITISQVVDLSQKVMPRVKIGFSAASSVGGRQLHLIRSWSFSSSLTYETSYVGTA